MSFGSEAEAAAARSVLGEENRPRLTAEQRAARRALVEGLLVGLTPEAAIEREVRRQFGTGRSVTRRVIAAVRAAWASEDAGRRPFYKASQVRRLAGHIAKARAGGHWGAVASLERLLADVTGTRAPVEVDLRLDSRAPEALSRLLVELSPEQVRTLAERARAARAALPVGPDGRLTGAGTSGVGRAQPAPMGVGGPTLAQAGPLGTGEPARGGHPGREGQAR